jgi:7 transmembrane helices usually fused to an inactive transglutaminase/Transglutaminase-like superfamily
MSRTTLCGITAACLALGSLGVMAVRYRALGDEVKLPSGPNVWKVTMTVQGRMEGNARVLTASPLDFNRQHILRETYRSTQMQARPPEARQPQRRRVLWTRKGGVPDGSFKLRCEFICSIDQVRPTAPMTRLGTKLYAPPARGAYLDVAQALRFAGEPSDLSGDYERVVALARQRTAGKDRLSDQAHALFQYVDAQIANEPSISGTAPAGAAECLAEGSGDSGAKSRLLLALLRSRGIPSRMVTGVTLAKGSRQAPHLWVEAWLHDRWLPLCPFYHHYGRVPSTYLVFGHTDLALVRGKHVADVRHAFLVERYHEEEAAVQDSLPRRFFRAVSLYMLPPSEQRLVQFLLLMPVAALIVCVYRNLIGLNSFGTFAPALVGLAFRELCTIPGLLTFVSILLLGWILRRVLDHYHLLQVPRVAVMLSLVVTLLIGSVVAANHFAMPATRYVSLFPLVILTGMIERFWTLEAEDGTLASFKTLLTTLLVSATVAILLSVPALERQLFRYPETLGIIVAGQLLIGRYTGYRLLELFRFRDFLRPPCPSGELPA